MSDLQAFSATNAPNTCLWCGRRLPRAYGDRRGYRGNGYLCSLRCGFQFGVRFAELGHRFELKENSDGQN